MNTNKSMYRNMQKLTILLALFLMAALLGACAAPATQIVPSPQPVPTERWIEELFFNMRQELLEICGFHSNRVTGLGGHDRHVTPA